MLCAQRSRKRTIILSFELRRRSFSNVKIIVFFHISVCRTLKQVRLAKPAKTQKRVNFLAFSTPLFIYSKSDTTIIWCCGSLRTFVLICYLEFTFHVKHCESNIKFVTIIPVRIKKRKVKKGGNIPLSATHDFIPNFFIFFISKFSLYMIFRFLQFSCTK